MKKLILVAAMATMLPVAAIAAEEHNHSGIRSFDAKDPAERERLMQEQQKTMQEHMKQMGAGMDGKMGPGTMGGGPKAGAGN